MVRVRLGVIENTSKDSINAFLNGSVEKGASAHTDGWKEYCDLERSGFMHITTIASHAKEKAHTLFPRVHMVYTLVKRWILGTHQGSVSRKHMHSYLEEYTYRFNRRRAKSITYSFQRLTEGLVREQCLPYWKIIGREFANQPLKMAAYHPYWLNLGSVK